MLLCTTARWKGVSRHRSMFSPQLNPSLAVAVSYPGLATGSQPHSTSLVWLRRNHMKEMTGIKKPIKGSTLLRVHLGEFVSPGYHMDSQSVSEVVWDWKRRRGEKQQLWELEHELRSPFQPRASVTLNSLHSLGMGLTGTLCTFTRALLHFHLRSPPGYGFWKLA